MAQRLVGLVRQEVLLRDIGDVLGVRVLGEQMVDTAGPWLGRTSLGIEAYHSSVFEKVGSTSKITPRKG